MSRSDAHELLEKLIDLSGGASEGRYILALDSEGLEQVPSQLVVRRVEYEVHRVTTELGLRRIRWKLGGKAFIGIMSRELAERLPPDLIRGAAAARVHALEPADVLASALGTTVLALDDDNTRALALEYVEALRAQLQQRTLPTMIDNQLLEELLVELVLGERMRSWSGAQLLARCWERASGWDARIKRLMARQLPLTHGAAGRLVCWALEEEGTQRFEELVVRGILLTQEGREEELPTIVWGQLWDAERSVGLARATLRLLLGRIVSELLREERLGEQQTRAVIQRADEQARALLTPAQIQRNPILPSGFEQAATELAEGLARGAEGAAEGLLALKTHRAQRLFPRLLAVLEPMARLARFVESARQAGEGRGVAEWARWYQEQGAFVDWALMQLQRAQASEQRFIKQSGALVAQVRELRQHANERFAALLAPSWERALHSPGVIPVHQLWTQLVLPRLERGERVFVVVLDGCSYAAFLELLSHLSVDALCALGLGADEEGRVRGAAGLALLPSVTSHSRGALFLGQIPNDPVADDSAWRDKLGAKTDRARFNQNPALGERSRKLLLKGELVDGGQQLLAALDDATLEVVAAVFNAVDDQIGSSNTGVPLSVDPAQITGLLPALHHAIRHTKRRVLITADHGHTLYIDKQHFRGQRKAARYTGLAAGEEVPEGFIEIDLRGLGGSGAEPRMAFAWRSGVYAGSPAVGYHGGCAQEELIVPMAWLEEGGAEPDAPPWWYDAVRHQSAAPLEVEEPEEIEEAPRAKQVKLL